LGQLIFSLT